MRIQSTTLRKIMERLRTAFLLLVLAPALSFAAGGLFVAQRSGAGLRPELDRHAALRAAAYLRWERRALEARLRASADLSPISAPQLGIQRYSVYEGAGLVSTAPPDAAPVSLSSGTPHGESMLAAARRGAIVVDLQQRDASVHWLAYLPAGERLVVALLPFDAETTQSLSAQTGYELAVYYDGQRVEPALGDWPQSIPTPLADTLASLDRAVDFELAGTSVTAAPLKDFDDWDLIGAVAVRRSAAATPLAPTIPLFPALALILSAILFGALLWRASTGAAAGPARLRRVLAPALLLPALAAGWLAAGHAGASARLSDARLELSARIIGLARDAGGEASPTDELPGQIAHAPASELAQLAGTDVVLTRGDSVVRTSLELPVTTRVQRALRAERMAATGRVRAGSSRLAYRRVELSPSWHLLLLTPPYEDARKGVLFWLAGFYGLLAVGALVFTSLATTARSRMELREAKTAWTFVAPSLVLLLIFTAAPLLFALYLSFHGWNLLEPAKPFVGVQHYVELLGDGLFWNAAKNTLIYSFYVPLTMVCALGVAMLLNRSIKGVALLRAIFFMPYITSFVAISIVWQWMYDPDFGLLNWALGEVGLGPYPWLSSPNTALLALILMAVWIHIGFQMVIFLAGLQAIPSELYEAAAIDGAGPWRRFWRITLPLLRPTTFFVLVTSVIGSFQVFTFVYVMTEGGPLRATDVIVYHIYQNAWQFLRMGYASAMSWVLFAVIFVITLLQFRFLGRKAVPQ